MKTVFVLLVGLVNAMSAIAAESTQVVLSETKVVRNIEVSDSTVKLSIAGYATPLVKILVPVLADITFLDHRNEGEGAPCMSTHYAKRPHQVVQQSPATEPVEFVVTLKKHLSMPDDKTCVVELVESVDAFIRDFKFEHHRRVTIGNRHIDDCR